MKSLNIFQVGSNFVAGSSDTNDEMHNLNGSVFDLWSAASDLLKNDNEDHVSFNFKEFSYSSNTFQAEWNDDLVGYVIIFNDGKSAQTQTYTETNRLHADYGDEYLERYTEYDDELSNDQEQLIEEFVQQVNKLKSHYA